MVERLRGVEVAHAREALAAARAGRLVGNLLHLVADALEVVDDLGDGQHHPQVDGRRLAPRDNLRALLVHRDLQLVDRGLALADRVDAPRVVLLLERLDRARQLLLDDPAHRQDARADRLHLRVELLVRVFGHVALTRSGRGGFAAS